MDPECFQDIADVCARLFCLCIRLSGWHVHICAGGLDDNEPQIALGPHRLSLPRLQY
jgi:hypothetical protein